VDAGHVVEARRRAGEGGADRRPTQVPQLRQRPRLDGTTGAHDADPVAERLDLGEDVARQQDRATPLPGLAHAGLEDLLHERVQARGRLVQQQQLDVGGERCDQRDLLPVALGVRAVLPSGVQLEPLQQLGPSSVDRATRSEPHQQVHRLAAREVRPQRHVSGHVRQPTVQSGRVAPRVTAEELHVAAVVPEEAEQHPQRGRLAGSVGPEEAVHLAGGHLQVESVERENLAEGLDESVDADRVAHVVLRYAHFTNL
jgi:hypothetical protein